MHRVQHLLRQQADGHTLVGSRAGCLLRARPHCPGPDQRCPWCHACKRLPALWRLQVGQVKGPLSDGWGLATDGTLLIATDSSADVAFIDPDTMKVCVRVCVRVVAPPSPQQRDWTFAGFLRRTLLHSPGRRRPWQVLAALHM
jgi:hypothetical protein